MEPKAERKETITSHRARGRGRKFFGTLVLGAVVIAGVGLARGVGGERGGSPYGHHCEAAASPERIADRVDQMLDHLDVTDTQRARIEGLVDDLAPEIAELAARRNELRDRVVSALAAEELTDARIESLQREVGERTARLAERAVEITFQVAAELTPEQRARLVELPGRR